MIIAHIQLFEKNRPSNTERTINKEAPKTYVKRHVNTFKMHHTFIFKYTADSQISAFGLSVLRIISGLPIYDVFLPVYQYVLPVYRIFTSLPYYQYVPVYQSTSTYWYFYYGAAIYCIIKEIARMNLEILTSLCRIMKFIIWPGGQARPSGQARPVHFIS